MAKFRGSVVTCKVCGSGFKVPPSRALTAEFCSIKCASVGRGERQRKRVQLTCDNCGKEFEAHACHAHRRTYCSRACQHASEEILAAQSARVAGSNNPRWKGGVVNHSDGYLYSHAPEHPFASNGYVLAHRRVMERWLRKNEPESPFLIRLGNQLYLSPDFHVHHKDEDKVNNAIRNLQCLTPSEHRRHHNDVRRLSSS
jgi:endogenous inhibitor of DNA gyrase (YacG/DUF329 family)